MMETMYKIQTLEKLIDSGMDDKLIGEIYGLDHEEIKYLIEYDKEIRTGDRA